MNATWWVDQTDLDEAQTAVIDLAPDGNYLIKGAPGSGKTNLLLLRAKFLSLSNLRNVVVVVLTRSLRHFLASGAARYALREDQIVTSRWLYGSVLKNHGQQPDRDSDYEISRQSNLERVLDIVRRGGLKTTYDAILVDEGQDYTTDEFEVLMGLTSRLSVTADSRQRIFHPDDGVGTFARTAQVVQLEAHYRNGLAICRLADAVALRGPDYINLEPTSNYNEDDRPSSVSVYSNSSVQAQCLKAVELADVERKAYPNELIGILVPHKADTYEVARILRGTSLTESVALVQEDEAFHVEGKSILVSTIHSAKGLEFRTAHLLNLDKIAGFTNERNLVFTAVTRAKTTLSIHHGGPLPLYLESALALTQGIRRPTISELFTR